MEGRYGYVAYELICGPGIDTSFSDPSEVVESLPLLKDILIVALSK
jgi:hypothetical protein